MSTHKLTRRAGTLVAIAAVLAVSACGGTSSGNGGKASPAPSVAVDQALADTVPAAIKADGKILIGTDGAYPPNEFLDTDGKTVKGFEVDLFNAVAAKLGLKTEWAVSSFDAIIPGVASAGKYEVGVSSFTINPERMKEVTMVSYFSTGTQWATAKGNPKHLTPDDVCGKRIAVQKATVQVPDITKRSTTCTSTGKPAITLDHYQGQDEATAAVISGKDDAMLADLPVSGYAVSKSDGQLELLGPSYDSAPYGFVVAKDQTAFGEALAGAVKALIADGTYTGILKKWNVDGGAITSPAVNPTTA